MLGYRRLIYKTLERREHVPHIWSNGGRSLSLMWEFVFQLGECPAGASHLHTRGGSRLVSCKWGKNWSVALRGKVLLPFYMEPRKHRKNRRKFGGTRPSCNVHGARPEQGQKEKVYSLLQQRNSSFLIYTVEWFYSQETFLFQALFARLQAIFFFWLSSTFLFKSGADLETRGLIPRWNICIHMCQRERPICSPERFPW